MNTRTDTHTHPEKARGHPKIKPLRIFNTPQALDICPHDDKPAILAEIAPHIWKCSICGTITYTKG